MNEKKQFRKSLKGPDEFQVKALAIVDWLDKYKKQIAIAFSPVLLIVAVGLGYQKIAQYQAEERREALTVIDLKISETELAAERERKKFQKEIDALEIQVDELSELEEKLNAQKSNTETNDKETSKDNEPGAKENLDELLAGRSKEDLVKEKASVSSQVEELQKKLEEIEPDHSESVTAMKSFFAENDSTPEGWRAGITAAMTLVQKKNFSEAEAIIRNVVSSALDEPLYQIQVRNLLVSILEEVGKLDEAIKEIDLLVNLTQEADLKPKMLFTKGRLLLQNERKEEAYQVFDQLIADFSNSPEAQKARSAKILW